MTTPHHLFLTHRAPLTGPALADLTHAVRAHHAHLHAAQSQQELLAIDLADLLCTRLEILLALAPTLPDEARADIVGAARYFVSEDDAVPDNQSCTGLDDDVEVFNHVARRLGRADLVIPELERSLDARASPACAPASGLPCSRPWRGVGGAEVSAAPDGRPLRTRAGRE